MVAVKFSEGWIPLRVYSSASGLMIDWCNIGAQRFTESFFEQTVSRALANPVLRLLRRQTPIETAEAMADERPALTPTAFIFHLSRCGSTLVSQMLAAVPRNVVISEAPPLDQVLQAQLMNPAVTRSQQVRWLRGLIRALGWPRTGETGYFIKWDSWHIRALPLIHEAFPTVPWMFLYRDPVEVMVSHTRMRGSQMVPGLIDSRIFGPDWSSVPVLPLDEYGARVLGRLCEAALEHLSVGDGRLVNFTELPDAVLGRLAPILGGDYTRAERERMLQTCRTHAKQRSLPYVDDAAAKQRAATTELRQLANRWVAEPYQRLEAIRLAPRSA